MQKTNRNGWTETTGGPGTGRRIAGARNVSGLRKQESGNPEPRMPEMTPRPAAVRTKSSIPRQKPSSTVSSGSPKALAGTRRSGLTASTSGAALVAAAGCARPWWQGMTDGIGKAWKWARTLLLQAAAVGRSRLQRRTFGQRPMTVIDQIAAGPRLRAVLLQVDGKRILLVANGEHAPALLDLGATPSASRRLAASKSNAHQSSAKDARPTQSRPRSANSGKSASGWNAGDAIPLDTLAEDRLFDRATGGEIQ